MALQFFTGDQFQKKHVDLIAKGKDRILFKFDKMEQTVLVLVCLTNTLWLPIFQFQIWELNHLISILDEHDEQGTLIKGKQSKDIKRKTI